MKCCSFQDSRRLSVSCVFYMCSHVRVVWGQEVLSHPNPMPPRDSKSCMDSAHGWGLHQVCEPGQMVGGSHPWRPIEASTGA